MDGKPRLIALLLLLIMGNTDPRGRFLRLRPGSCVPCRRPRLAIRQSKVPLCVGDIRCARVQTLCHG